MKTETKVKSIFDPLVQRDLLGKARVVNSKGCVHLRDRDADMEVQRKQFHKPFELLAFRCSICQIGFENLQQQRSHFKTDWHVFNVRQKMSSKAAITESLFVEKYSNEDDGFDSAGISESDTDDTDEDDITSDISSAEITFKTDCGHYFSLYKTLFESKSKDQCSNCYLHETAIKSLESNNCWIVLMMSGGHFAAAVFHKQEVIAHKTIHRYVIRAKRGTVQSQRDGKQSGKSPRSAGAHIRRQNEIALVSEIRELLQKWKDHICHADRIFLSWPQRAKSILFDGKEPILRKSDSRVAKVPLVTGKPTFDELKRAHRLLSTFKLKDHPDDEQLKECPTYTSDLIEYSS